MKKRLFSLLVCLCLLASLVPCVHAAGTITEAGGWNETIYAVVSGVSDADVTGVSWSGTASGSLKGEDLQYLVRADGKNVRIDIPGIAAGTYTLTVTTKSGSLTKSGIKVEAQDRSGYAHYGTTEGVGAYNNDGTLKKNAIVLYVTEENKNTVSVTSKDGTTVTGIGNILNSVGMDTGSGLNSKGGKANTNQDILRKLASDGTPLVVRIIGNVKAPEGVTAYNSVDYGGSTGDNGYMVRMSGGKDITIEGIGTDAGIDGWGLHFICQTADYAKGWGRSFEVRNISFRNVPEDCVGMEGQQDESTLTAPVERCWVHNCAFYAPTIANPAESDKDGGDGACDFKRGQYFTNSYCYYSGYHKTNLVGSSDSSLQYHLTYHHNYWKNCESRGPLARQANIHMYNNVFEHQSSYCMSLRANTYIFSEYNLFYGSKNVVEDKKSGGVCKSYNDSFTCCTGSNDAQIVTNKSDKVTSGNKYANFDTNSSLSYIPSGNYLLQTDISTMKAVVMAYAGTQKSPVVTPDQVNTSVIPTAYYPTKAVALPYNHSLNSSYVTAKSGTYDNVVFHVSKISSSQVTLGGTAGCDIVFYVDQPVNITVGAVSGTFLPVLCNAAGEALLTGSGTVENLPAGYYFIQSGGYDVGSGKFKEAGISSLAITAYDPNATTQPIPPTPEDPDNGGSSGGDSSGGGSSSGGATTIPAGSYIHNFTENGKESTFFTISGNLSTSKGNVTYGDLKLTQCLKMESSTNISFTAPENGTLTLIFGGSTSASGKTVKVDGTKVTVGNDGILSVTVSAGSHTVTKGDSINLFYMAYTSNSVADGGNDGHAHNYSAEVTKAATCTAKGVKTFTCSCGDSYTEEIPALGHDYKSSSTDATCTKPGTVTKTCSRCGDSSTETGVKLDHDYQSVTVEPTCTKEGSVTHTCKHCGDSYTEKLEKLDHDYDSEIVDSTCTVAGSATHTCEVCGHSYTETLPLAEHSYEGVRNEPTCTEAGSADVVCSVCGDTYKGPLEPLGHDYEGLVTDPTCLEPGFTTYICSRCGDSYVDDHTPATGHSYGPWTVLKEATAEEAGLREQVCACGHKITEEIPKLTAEPDPTDPTQPDGEDDGGIYIVMYCVIALAVLSVGALVVILILKQKKK